MEGKVNDFKICTYDVDREIYSVFLKQDEGAEVRRREQDKHFFKKQICEGQRVIEVWGDKETKERFL